MSQPQPPIDEHGEAREALSSAVASYGPRILQSPQMLGNVVTDLLPDMPREQNLLIAAAEVGVATDLSRHVRDQHLTPSTAVQLAARALIDKKAIDPSASMWVTTEYAKALGYDVPAYTTQPIPAPGAPAAESVPPSAQSVPPAAQSVPPSAQSVPPAAQSVPPSAQSVPPSAQSVPPSAQSVPPAAQSVPPAAQSVPPAAQSVPPWSVPPSPYAQQSVPPGGGYPGSVPSAPPWGYGPTGPTGPTGPGVPPAGGRNNRGIIIAAITTAAVVVIAVVAIFAAHALGGGTAPTPSPTPPPVSSTPPSPTPTTPSPTPTTPDPTQVANYVANLVVGNRSPGPMAWNGTTATQAVCDPRTVSNPPDPNTPTLVSCDITYSDGTTWRQTVTVDYDSAGDPIHVSANEGTRIG